MTEEETKRFLTRCQRYARHRRASEDFVQEFPAFAWEKIYRKNYAPRFEWLWKQFVRTKMGRIDSKKNVAEKSTITNTESLERGVATAPKSYDYFSLSRREQMMVCLLHFGFSIEEIADEFPLVDFLREQSLSS